MADENTEFDKILSTLENSGDDSSSDIESEERLEKLHQEGAITDEEYEVLQSHSSVSNENSSSSSSGSVDFGKPISTSEGANMDFSIVGVVEDVDTTNLTHEHLDEGGPGRTMVFWQIHNHSNDEIKLKHKDIEHIGEDQIAYNRDGNPLRVDNFAPGWRTENWEDIAGNTRVKYVSCLEMPVRLGSVKMSGHYCEGHDIEVTEDMFFPKSEAPVNVDI